MRKRKISQPPEEASTSADDPGSGFYARQFLPDEIRDLRAYFDRGMLDEIHMLRVAIRRFFEATSSQQDVETMTTALGSLGTAATRLSSLLKTQAELGGENNDELSEAISIAIREAAKELNIL
jgi:hypothetical protein